MIWLIPYSVVGLVATLAILHWLNKSAWMAPTWALAFLAGWAGGLWPLTLLVILVFWVLERVQVRRG